MSNTIRITKEFSFEASHALYRHDGLCKNVHGHSYKLHVTIIGNPIEESKNVKFGMIIDFSDLKKIVKEETQLKIKKIKPKVDFQEKKIIKPREIPEKIQIDTQKKM